MVMLHSPSVYLAMVFVILAAILFSLTGEPEEDDTATPD